jgi:hypothetical protein
MRDGKLRNSAFANRTALHSDYYSTTQKTATPLNEWWTIERHRRDPLRPRSKPGARLRATIASTSEPARRITWSARNPHGAMVSQHHRRSSPRLRRACELFAPTSSQARGAIFAGSNPAKKIFENSVARPSPAADSMRVDRIGDSDSRASVAVRGRPHRRMGHVRAVATAAAGHSGAAIAWQSSRKSCARCSHLQLALEQIIDRLRVDLAP